MKTSLLLLTFFTIFSSYSQNNNLLLNGGFEGQTTGFPNDWTTDDGIITIDNTTVTEGLNSVKLVPSSSDPSMSPTSTISQSFQLTDTEEHIFTFNYFLPGSFPGNPVDLISYQFENLTSDNAFFFTQGETINTGDLVYNAWNTVTYTIKVLAFKNGASATDIKFTLRANSFAEDGEIYFDDLFIDSNQALSVNTFEANSKIINYIKNKTIYVNNAVKSCSVYTMDGKSVLETENIISNQINANGLNKGIYLFVFNLEDKRQLTKKILLD